MVVNNVKPLKKISIILIYTLDDKTQLNKKIYLLFKANDLENSMIWF